MKLKISILILAILLVAANTWSFDSKPGNIEIDMHSDSTYVKITTTGVALSIVPTTSRSWDQEPGSEQKKTAFLLQGSGFVAAYGYIVTAAHIVEPDRIMVKTSQYARTYGQVTKVLNRVIVITSETELEAQRTGVPATIEYIDMETDIAVLRYDPPNNLLEPIPYEMAKTLVRGRLLSMRTRDRISIGNAVAVVVRGRDEKERWSYGVEVRYGKILSRNIDESVERKDALWFNPYDFSTDLVIYPGDSGSPVFVFNMGKPILVGVARATKMEPGMIPMRSKEPRCYVARIDRAKMFIDATTN